MSTPINKEQIRNSALKSLKSLGLTPETKIVPSYTSGKLKVRNAVTDLLNKFRLQLEMSIQEILQQCVTFEDLIRLTEERLPLTAVGSLNTVNDSENDAFSEEDTYVPSAKYSDAITKEMTRQAKLKKASNLAVKLRKKLSSPSNSDGISLQE